MILPERSSKSVSSLSARPSPMMMPPRSEERRVGKECRSLCDWSSDVCSSDLGHVIFSERRIHDPAGALIEERLLAQREAKPHDDATQIGRASCRERV